MRRMSVTEIKRTRLAKWMFRNGVKGKDLAERVGTSPATISRLRNGEPIIVSDEVRQKILAATGLARLD